VAVLVGAGIAAAAVGAVVVTRLTSTAGSDSSEAGIISVSRSSNEARKSAIAFRMPSGNGPDRVLAQFCSIRRSSASTFSTVFISSSVGVGDVAVVGSTIAYTAIGAVRNSCLW